MCNILPTIFHLFYADKLDGAHSRIPLQLHQVPFFIQNDRSLIVRTLAFCAYTENSNGDGARLSLPCALLFFLDCDGLLDDEDETCGNARDNDGLAGNGCGCNTSRHSLVLLLVIGLAVLVSGLLSMTIRFSEQEEAVVAAETKAAGA